MDPILIAVLIAGLFLGALLNLVIIRLPLERSMGGWPRCTGCQKPLAWWQLLPLIGWLAQGGRARCCGKRLNWLFPLVELCAGFALAWFYARYGLSIVFFYLAFVTSILLVVGAIDWLHRSIYNVVVFGGTLVALLASLVVPGHNIANALLGALGAGFVFILFFMLARIMFPAKSSPFGLGDVYLGIFIGAAVGLTNLMIALFYGMLLAGVVSAGLIVARRAGRTGVPEYISYGTFLCLGALGYLLWHGL